MATLVRTILMCALAMVTSLLLSTETSAQGPPNVIVIVADDAGYSDWGFMDGVSGSNPTPTDIPTPNLDALAGRGVKFSRAYVAQSCQPTRAALVTGGYQNRIGNEVVGNNYYLPSQGFASRGIQEGVPGATTTIWERMKSQGYTTAAVGKWHLGQTSEYVAENGNTVPGNRPEDQGVDEFFGIWHGSRGYNIGCCGGSPTQQLRKTIVDSAGTITDTNEEANFTGQYFTNVIGDYAVDFIDRNHDSGNPFFLYQSFTAPHTPLQNSPDFNDPRLAGLSGDRKTYASMMLTMDKEIGRIIDRLDDPNGDGNTSDSIQDNTMIVFINDNGGADSGSSSPNGADNGILRRGKGTPWEGGIRVPLIIAGAGVDQSVHGSTYDRPVHGVDVLPTAFAAAGGTFGPGENKIDGVDLLPFINGTDTSNPHDVIVNRHRTQFSVIKGDMKLVWSGGSPSANHQLYNIANDISETTNIASANPAVVAELQRDLTDHEVVFDKPRYEILGRTNEETINVFDHFTFKPAVGGGGGNGGESSILEGSTGNGDFEDSEPASGPISYENTANWFNATSTETINFTNDSQTGGSSQPNSRAGMPFQNRVQVNNTGHTITAAGEVFDISYDFGAGGPLGNWDGDELMRAFLFTTNSAVDGNLTEGDITELAGDTYNVNRAADGQWTTRDAPAFYTTTADDIGKTVYFGMEFLDPSVTNLLFPRIDVIQLNVTTPGGPSTIPTTNWSDAGAWFEGGTTNVETMFHFDAFAGAVLEFPTTDTGSYISNNNMVRSTGLEYMLNKMVLSGTFNGAQDQSAVIQGNAVLFTNDLDGVAPQIAVDATNSGASEYSYSIDLNLVMYNDLTITGDGDVTVTINGEISDYFEPRNLNKSGTSTVVLTADNTYEGDTSVEQGTLSITNAFLEDSADVYLSTGATLDLDFIGTDTIDSLFIDGTSQAVGTWGALGSGADNESALLTGTGLLSVSTLAALNGDFDGDGDVDAADFLSWQRTDGTPAGLAAWRDNYGNQNLNAIGSSVAVPEPSCIGLLAAVGCIVSCSRMRALKISSPDNFGQAVYQSDDNQLLCFNDHLSQHYYSSN